MPETIHKTFYACTLCRQEYSDYNNACNCETLPLLEDEKGLKKFNVGDKIQYQTEWQMGSRWSYSGTDGNVIEKKLVRQGNYHQWLYWTDAGEGVTFLEQYGELTFISPAELKR